MLPLKINFNLLTLFFVTMFCLNLNCHIAHHTNYIGLVEWDIVINNTLTGSTLNSTIIKKYKVKYEKESILSADFPEGISTLILKDTIFSVDNPPLSFSDEVQYAIFFYADTTFSDTCYINLSDASQFNKSYLCNDYYNVDNDNDYSDASVHYKCSCKLTDTINVSLDTIHSSIDNIWNYKTSKY